MHIDETDGRLRLVPPIIPRRPLVVLLCSWLATYNFIAIVGIGWIGGSPKEATMMACGGTLISLFMALVADSVVWLEGKKGPFLESDSGRRILLLYRSHRELGFDEIEAFDLLTRWRYDGEGDWTHIGELTLIVHGDGGRPTAVPVLVHEATPVEELAGRLARLVGKPLRCTRFDRAGWVGQDATGP